MMEYASTAAPSRKAPSFVIVMANAIRRGFNDGADDVIDDDDDDNDDVIDDDDNDDNDDDDDVVDDDDDVDVDDNDDNDDDDDDDDGLVCLSKNLFSKETSSLFHILTTLSLS